MNSVRDLLENAGIEIAPPGHRHSTPRFVNVDCPYCSPNSGKYKLGITHDGTFATCWTCGRHRPSEVLTLLVGDRRTVLDGLKTLGATSSWAHQDLPKRHRKLRMPSGVGDVLPAHRRYLRRRGFDPDEIIRLWDVRGIGIAKELSWHLFIPIYQYGRMVSWTSRALSNHRAAKYWTAKDEDALVPRNEVLYGEDYCRTAVAVCEGPLDVWRIGPGAVATLGVGYSAAQVLKLSRYSTRLVIFDNEPEAQRRAQRLCDELEAFYGTTMNIVLDSKDPGESSWQEVKAIRKLLRT